MVQGIIFYQLNIIKMRKIFLLLLLFPLIGVSQVLTIGGEVLKHSNYVLRKNYVIIGGTAWVEKAPKLGVEINIYTLCVYNGKLYGGTALNGKLYEWNGTNAWIEKAPKLGAEDRIYVLCVFNNKLYGGTASNGKLYEWNAILKP